MSHTDRIARSIRLLLCIAVLALPALIAWAPAAADPDNDPANEPARTEAAQKFLQSLSTATWTSRATANGFGVRVRNAPVCSQGMLDAVAAADRLTADQRQQLARVIEITITEPGWLYRSYLTPGTYWYGVARTSHNLQFVLRTNDGQTIGTWPFWINTPTDRLPIPPTVERRGGSVAGTITFADIRFHFSYLLEAPIREACGDGRATTVGRITLVSDLGQPDAEHALATELDASLEVHARLLGCEMPDDERFRLYLYATEASYQKVEAALTGGQFKENGAVASDVTCEGYVWHVPYATDAALETYGIMRKTRALLVHELHHLVQYRMFENARFWPTWLKEGLADFATGEMIPAHAPTFTGSLVDARIVGRLPAAEDLLAGVFPDGERNIAYAGWRAFMRELWLTDREKLQQLIRTVDEYQMSGAADDKARELLETGFGQPDAILAAAIQRSLGEPADPLIEFGQYESIGSGDARVHRCGSGVGGSSRAIFPSLCTTDTAVLRCETAFLPVSQRQNDLYLAYARGSLTARFLKVAFLPDRTVVFVYRRGEWDEIHRVDHESALAVGTAAEPVWHRVEVRLAAIDRQLSVRIGNRAMQINLPSFLPVRGTRAGIGGYDGCQLFRRVVIRSE